MLAIICIMGAILPDNLHDAYIEAINSISLSSKLKLSPFISIPYVFGTTDAVSHENLCKLLCLI